MLPGWEGIGGGVPKSCDAYPDLNFTEVVRSNLGGFGPDTGEEGLVLKAYDYQVRRHIHVVINAGSSYRPYHQSQNGLFGMCGTLNIQSGTDVALRFSFRDAVTDKPALLPQVALTFFDLDQCEKHHCVEYVTIQNVTAYRLSPHTELMVLRNSNRHAQADDKIPAVTFYSTTRGDWYDNPVDVDHLTIQQMNRGVSVAFHHTTELSLVFGASPGKGARYLSFAGFPGLLCLEEQASTPGHQFPPPPAPPPAAVRRPPELAERPPVLWRPSRQGNLSGLLTIRSIDWSLLRSRPELAARLGAAVRSGVASAAGLRPEDVSIRLEPGSTVVRAAVTLPQPLLPSEPVLLSGADGTPIEVPTGSGLLLRARLEDSDGVCRAITRKVRRVPGVHRVASGPVNLTGWHLLPGNQEGTQGTVTGLGVLDNVSYLLLMGSPAVLTGMKSTISRAIAKQAGTGLEPSDVDLVVFPESVLAHVAAAPPDARSAAPDSAPPSAPISKARERLQQRADWVCQEVSSKVNALNNIEEASTGIVKARNWRLQTADSQDAVKGTLAIHNVDYELLTANPVLFSKFKDEVGKAIASTAGGGCSPGDVRVQLFPGSVVLRAMVTPSADGRGGRGGYGVGAGGLSGDDVRGERLCRAITDEVRAVPGIRQVAANLTMRYDQPPDAGATSWRPGPASRGGAAESEGVVVSCIADGLDYGRLLLNPALLSRVEQAVRRAVTDQAGGILAPGDLTLSLNVGSVVAAATVRPPASPADAARARLGRLDAVDRKVWEEVQRVEGIKGVEVNSGNVLPPESAGQGPEYVEPRAPASWDWTRWLGLALALLGLLMLLLLCLCCLSQRKKGAGAAGRATSRTREVYFYLPVGDESNAQEGGREAEDGTEVAFRDLNNDTKSLRFRYRDHGMRLQRGAPPKVATFLVNSHAHERGVQAGWVVSKIGSRKVDRHESGEAVERLLSSHLERHPPAPLRLEFETPERQTRTFLLDRQPLGLEFTKTAPFRVEHHKPDSYAREVGIELGWVLTRVGTVNISGATAFDSLLTYIAEGLCNLPQNPTGPRLQVDFLDAAGDARALFFQRHPLGLRLARHATSPGSGRRGGVAVDGFDFNSYARDRGVQVGWLVARIGERAVPSGQGADEVAGLLARAACQLPLWPLRMDFVPAGSSGTRTMYFDHQPLGLEFTKAPPIRVEHFKPDSLAQALGVQEGWAVARVGDAVVTKSTGLQQFMGYIQAGLDHLPQEPRGLRVDFADTSGRRRRCHFHRRPVGLVLSRQPPASVESFAANSYAIERGVQVGWTVVRVGERELPPSATPQEAESLLEEQSASLPLWPLRVDFDVGKGANRTVYFDRQILDVAVPSAPPFRVESLDPGGHAANRGVELGWIVRRVGHVVVDRETPHETVRRSIAEGCAHLPA